MDRLDALEAFVVTVDRGSLSSAARALRRSAASVTRAVAALEDHLGVELLRRTTRSLKLTEAGERYLTVARRVLADLADAERAAASGIDAPHGVLTVTAPAMFGSLHVRPVVDAYLSAYPGVRVRLLLLDRVVNLVDEGVDVAIRIAHLPDSALVGKPVGAVRRVVCASPDYLARHGRPRTPSELANHRCISFSGLTPSDVWTFGAGGHGGRPTLVTVQPILTVNTAEAALGSASAGQGVTCALVYQAAPWIESKALVPILEKFEPALVPVHLVYPAGSATTAKVRAFIELATPSLRSALGSTKRVG